MSAKGATGLPKSKAKIQLEDALQNHEVPEKKLLSPETQRISSILENCISRVEIAAALPSILQLKSVSSFVDNEKLSRAVEKHQILAERLEKLEVLQLESDGDQKGEAGVRAQLEEDFEKSVMDLLRLFEAHPDAISDWKSEPGIELGESECMLIVALKKFHSLMMEKLMTSPDSRKEDPQAADELKCIISQQEETAAAIKELDVKILQEKSELKKLHLYLGKTDRQEADLLALTDKQCQSLIGTSKVKQRSVQREIDQLNNQLNTLIREHREAERELQEKNEKVETEIEDLLQTFDKKMEEKQAKLEINTMELEREEEELRKLEKSFSVLEVEYNQIMEKRRLAEEKRIEEMKELELKTKAAIFAQAWWRGYCTRKALKNKSKGKKAKKGKGKKTK
ncbi:dynein regulatory complex protein 10 [Symphorus nematophorus]